jgi:hypothetical protein
MRAHRSPALALAVTLILFTFTPAFAQWPQGFSVVVGTDQTPRGVAQGFCYPGETSGDFYVSFGAWGGVGLADWQVAHLGTTASCCGPPRTCI